MGFKEKILVWKGERQVSTTNCKFEEHEDKEGEIIFRAEDFKTKPTPRYWDGQCWYLADRCRDATEEEREYFEDMEEQYGKIHAISS